MKRMKRRTAAYLTALAVAVAAVTPAAVRACVGKTLYLGRLPGVEQEVLAQIFIWLVSERTGTSVDIRSYPDSRAGHSAMQKAEIDLFIEDSDDALHTILGESVAPPAGDVRTHLRQEYAKRFNFIWLEPWGLTHGDGAAVAPVVRKDTLKKFPALSRLVNKLAGVIDDATVARLVEESAASPVREVTKRFLKERKLI